MRTTVVATVALVLVTAGTAWSSPATRVFTQDGRIAAVLTASGRSGAQLTVIDGRTGDVRRRIRLRGDYSLDAISPNGRTIYVIRYLSRDRTHYAVQWLNAAASRPVPRTVVEKGEPGEEMTGNVLSRAQAREWVYTLYGGAGHTPFVHALNTAERFTVCIDLDALLGRGDLASLGLRLEPQHDRLDVITAQRRPVLRIDTESYEVTEVKPASVSPPAARGDIDAKRSVSPVVLAAIGGALAVALIAARTRLRRRVPT